MILKYYYTRCNNPMVQLATNAAIDCVTQRGDAIAIIDTRNYGSTLNQAVTSATSVDSSYAATYWPWVQVLGTETGKLVFGYQLQQ